MSQEETIHLKNLIITSINKNIIKIQLDSLSQEKQNKIHKIFEQIRWKYFKDRDQFDWVYLPLRYQYDESTGEILEHSYYLLLTNTKESKYFDRNGKITFENLTALSSQPGTLKITVDFFLTGCLRYGKTIVKAKISQAVIQLNEKLSPGHSDLNDMLIDE